MGFLTLLSPLKAGIAFTVLGRFPSQLSLNWHVLVSITNTYNLAIGFKRLVRDWLGETHLLAKRPRMHLGGKHPNDWQSESYVTSTCCTLIFSRSNRFTFAKLPETFLALSWPCWSSTLCYVTSGFMLDLSLELSCWVLHYCSVYIDTLLCHRQCGEVKLNISTGILAIQTIFSRLHYPSGLGCSDYYPAARISCMDTHVLGGGHVGFRSACMRGSEYKLLYSCYITMMTNVEDLINCWMENLLYW